MKKAVMYGAGNIGRGFMGQLFSESGYEVVFIDVNMDIIDRLNTDGCYPVRVLTGKDAKEIMVTQVRGVNGNDMENVAKEIAEADIMATAVGVNILPRIAKPVSEGLKKRWQLNVKAPLNIILCENLLDANHYFEKLIKQELDESQKALFDKMVGLVEASIGRMVPVMTRDLQGDNPLKICVEEYCELPVDKEGFKGEIPCIKNMHPFSPFSFYIQRKLFIHNMGHALTAYLGRLKGYSYIWEAMEDPYIKLAILKAMQDSAIALSKVHDVQLDLILEYVDDLIYRFGNKQLGDTVERVGKDTNRKLSPNDRLVGAANLCLSHGIIPANICMGIAAAMKFDPDERNNPGDVSEILAVEGPEGVLRRICGLNERNVNWAIILEFYKLLENSVNMNEVLGLAVEVKRRKAS